MYFKVNMGNSDTFWKCSFFFHFFLIVNCEGGRKEGEISE